MAPRKNKNKKKINDECESSAAANKRMRMEILNRTTGVPFTSHFTQFPSSHMLNQQQRNPPPNTAVIGTDLQLAPPSPVQPQEAVTDDAFISTLILQQNFIINYHINQMVQGMEELWRRNLAAEYKKRREMEVERMRHLYGERASGLENMRVASEGSNNVPAQEDGQPSHFVGGGEIMQIICKNCFNRPASMLWLPCRHLSVCMVCDRRMKICPICSERKTESFHINKA